MKWNDDDFNTCLSLLKSGLSYKEISDIVGRSEGSIRSKLIRIGEKSSTYNKVEKIITKCLNCNSEIEHEKYRNRYFCTTKCSVTFNNKKRSKGLKSCLNCGENTNRRNKYCSNDCQHIYEKNLIIQKIESGDSSLYDRNYKNYLIIKYGEKCMECGWCEIHPITKKVPIQLEHIDGNSHNNNLDNLKLLCPNCHSLTPTYGALNKGSGRKNRKR